MILDIAVHLHYRVEQPTDLLLQIEAANLSDQIVRQTHVNFNEMEYQKRVPAEENIGDRLWLGVQREFVCDYTAQVEIKRPFIDMQTLKAAPPHLLSGDLVKYLLPSRYCLPDDAQEFVETEFGDHQGGAKIMAMQTWIKDHFQYTPGSSDAQTTSADSFAQRQGVCRDYAHVLISFARAAAIPARFVSAYAPFVSPQDFHAVVEVYLAGNWHLVDATGMADAGEIVRIGVGLDAANVAFMTTYGAANFISQSVFVLISSEPKSAH